MVIQDLLNRSLRDDSEIKRVEIIILTCNRQEVENECIRRILDNTFHPYKLVVYDNRPDSPAWHGTHISKVWNKLIKQSTCDYICLMNSDILVGVNWLEPMLDVFKRYENVGVVVPLLGESAPNYIQQKAKQDLPYEVNEQVSGSCFLFKKELIDKIGDFNNRFYFYGQETEWFQRVIKAGYKVYLQPVVTMEHLKRITVVRNMSEEFQKEEEEYLSKLLKEFNL